MDYLKRVIDNQLQDYLDAFGAVNIEGPKWCGKTTTAKQKAASIIELQDTDKRDEYLATALTKASLLLEGETPRLIDEWQDAPTLWDAVRVACDRRQNPHSSFSPDQLPLIRTILPTPAQAALPTSRCIP